MRFLKESTFYHRTRRDEMTIGILIGIVIGAIAWQIGMRIANNYRRKCGCYNCHHCGKVWDENK